MTFTKLIIYAFFGAIGGVVLSLLSAVGGFAGGGTSLLINSLIGNLLVSSLIGGALAAIAFHALIGGVDTFLTYAAKEKGDKSGAEVKPPSLAQDRRYLWGSASYFIATVIGVNLVGSFIANPTWNVIVTIVGSGLLGLLGLGIVVSLKLWQPEFRVKNEQR